MHFDVVVAVWGDLFRELFLKVCLPSLNAPGNLAALADVGSATLSIYTTATDKGLMLESGLAARLPPTIELRTVVVDGIGQSNRVIDSYTDLTRCHQLAVRNAAARNSVMVFLPGDGIWSDGSFASMVERFNEGKRAVLTTGMRVNAETYITEFGDTFLDSDSMTAVCRSTDLMASVADHLHDLTRSCFIDSDHFTTWPSLIIWPVDRSNLIVRSFHLHPMAVWPKVYRDFEGTIDGTLLDQTLDDLNEIHIVQDSSEILQINLDLPPHRNDLIGNTPASLDSIARWARGSALPYQRTVFRRYPISLSSGGASSEAYQSQSEASQRTADRIVELIADSS